MSITRRIFPTRFGQVHLRSTEGKGLPLVLLHLSPRSGEMWEELQGRLTRSFRVALDRMVELLNRHLPA